MLLIDLVVAVVELEQLEVLHQALQILQQVEMD